MTEGNEQIPSATMLPEGLEPYQQTPVFTEVSLPAGLRKDHSTKLGVWGLIHVLEGQLLYTITDPRRTSTEIKLNPESKPGVVEPTILHHVASPGLVQFYVLFYRQASRAAPLCHYEELAQRENIERRSLFSNL